MWGLGFFESDQEFIGEIDSPPGWEGILSFSVAAVCVLLLHLLRHADRRSKPKPFLILIPFGVLLLLGLLTGIRRMSGMNWFVVVGPVYLLYALVILTGLLGNLKRPGGLRRLMLSVPLTLVLFASCVCYDLSFPYYLPASYPEPSRSQLRMVRRLIEVEHDYDTMRSKDIPLSEAHFELKGEELIPDSIRENGRYGDYQYTIHFDTPAEGLFTIDAVPIVDKESLPSIHAFPTDPDYRSYVVYCMTIAKRNGEPATDKDQHFHRRGLINMLVKRW